MGKDIRKGCSRVNVMEICTHTWKHKMRPVETVPGMSIRMTKENDE
jgi:hypothetical protein